MKIFDYSEKTILDIKKIPKKYKDSGELFILCQNKEVPLLRDVFDFDESTIIDCADLDESVRYTGFDGYDFLSMVHVELSENDSLQREINFYVSSRYIVLVMPNHDSARLYELEKKLLQSAKSVEERAGRINLLYFSIFHNLMTDFSDTLETLEDKMQALSEEIVLNVEKNQFEQINIFKNMAYSLKKQLRALSYLGEQILLDENKLIAKDQARYFRNINTRLKKLYDFSESLYNLSSEMLYTYDSRLTMKMNDTVNKLTAITLLFGPLTVITGIYGMNFDVMPELKWLFGYPLTLIGMALIILILYIFLKKKKWL